MPPLPYTRPLIKISGEALMGSGRYGIDAGTLSAIAADLAAVVRRGARVAVVVGGGNIFRGMSGTAHGIDRVKARLHGHAGDRDEWRRFGAGLEARGSGRLRFIQVLPIPTICKTFSRDEAVADLEQGAVVVLAGGTGNPFFTTDTTAALRAAELGCDVILKATQVDGVYSRRSQEPSARRPLRSPDIFGGSGAGSESDGRRRNRPCPRQRNTNRGIFPPSKERYWQGNER